jgi:hypothetical protein
MSALVFAALVGVFVLLILLGFLKDVLSFMRVADGVLAWLRRHPFTADLADMLESGPGRLVALVLGLVALYGALSLRAVPNLSAYISKIAVVYDVDKNVRPEILIAMKIANAGAPSIAEAFRFAVRPADKEAFTLCQRREVFDENANSKVVRSPQEGVEYRLERDDSLADKVAENPIPTGGQAWGILLFDCGEAGRRIWRVGARFRLTFKDYKGWESTAEVTLKSLESYQAEWPPNLRSRPLQIPNRWQ